MGFEAIVAACALSALLC